MKNVTTEWIIANFINGKLNQVEVNGKPKIVKSPYGDAVYFNGVEDALFLKEMPLNSNEEFTVEMIFKPEINGPFEQRILHIGEIKEDRMLLEIRAVGKNWYFDGFVASKENKLALIDENLTHPLGQWYHVAFVVAPDSLTTFVNGVQELHEKYDFKPIELGRTSIGVRMNKVSWFKGAIYKIRITSKQLAPKDFMAL